ncbi:MAG: nucleoside triphosphate pyrophosphohydrolase [Patescibacteria group bacterium]
MRIEYGKLVRDKIPELIRAYGSVPVIRTLSDDEFVGELKKRLIEEAWEAHYADGMCLVEECADIFEVMAWMMRARGIDPNEVFAMAEARRDARGGFSEKAFLIAVEEGVVA